MWAPCRRVSEREFADERGSTVARRVAPLTEIGARRVKHRAVGRTDNRTGKNNVLRNMEPPAGSAVGQGARRISSAVLLLALLDEPFSRAQEHPEDGPVHRSNSSKDTAALTSPLFIDTRGPAMQNQGCV
jgi:hypothetical protein